MGFADFLELRICTSRTPLNAIARPINSWPVIDSPRKIHAKAAIWINMVLLIVLDSTAERLCKDIFHRVKAKAVLIAASQMMMAQF